MSGVSMDLRFTDRSAPLTRALNRLVRAGHSPRPMLKAMGEYLVRSTQDRFDAQESPEGQAWQPVQGSRWAVKRILKILTESSRLRDSIIYRAGSTTLEWGTNVIYAAIHQFGGKTSPSIIKAKRAKALYIPGIGPRKSVKHPGSVIPARPFVGISATDETELLHRIHDYYQAAVRG